MGHGLGTVEWKIFTLYFTKPNPHPHPSPTYWGTHRNRTQGDRQGSLRLQMQCPPQSLHSWYARKQLKLSWPDCIQRHLAAFWQSHLAVNLGTSEIEIFRSLEYWKVMRGGEGTGEANSDDGRESVALCILCARNSLRKGFHIFQEDLTAYALSEILLDHIWRNCWLQLVKRSAFKNVFSVEKHILKLSR